MAEKNSRIRKALEHTDISSVEAGYGTDAE